MDKTRKDLTFDDRLRSALSHSAHLIAYLCLVVGAVVGFFYMQQMSVQNQELIARVEYEGMVRANQNCEGVNVSRTIVSDILDRLAESGSTNLTPELRAELDEFLVLVDCPPPPAPLLSPTRDFNLNVRIEDER